MTAVTIRAIGMLHNCVIKIFCSDESRIDHDRVLALEAAIGREVQVTAVPHYRWERMKEEGDPFVAGVLQNHILVAGATL